MNPPSPADRSSARQPPALTVIVRSMDRPSLRAALDSISAQNFDDLEVVVVNALGRGHRPPAALTADARVRLVEAADGRPLPRARAANVGLRAARGALLIFLDDDDLMLPGHLARLAHALQQRPEAVAAYADVERGELGPQGWQPHQTFAADFDPVRLSYENFLPIHAVLFRRRCLDGGLQFDEELQLLEDWDFWLGCAAQGPFVRVPGVSARYVAGTQDHSAVFQASDLASRSLARVLGKWQPRLPAAHWVAIVERLLQAQRLELHAQQRLHDALQERDSLRAVLQARDIEIHNLRLRAGAPPAAADPPPPPPMSSEDPGLAALQAQSDALSQDPRFRALLRTHWPQLGRNGAGRPLSTRIHPGDQMLLHSLRHHRDPNAALSQYFNVALQQYHAARQVLDALLPPARGRVEVLDFACGFGRLIRFLCCCERELAISASEIQDEALQFVAAEFGVQTLPSAMQPEAFQPGRRFDFIWVASLFSHLPEGLFHRWLQRLLGLLTPDGVLCFSVHDELLVPPGERLPAGGLLFKGQSENADLDPDAYGTTYVSEAFVRAAVQRAAGGPTALHRIPKGLAHEQDLYVVPANPRRDLGALAGFRRGPWGWADERRIDEQGRLVVRGWAASIDDGALGAVRVRIDDESIECPTGLQRLDVRDAFGDPRLSHPGWSFERELPAGQRQPWVQVTAETARGECALLYAGWPGGRPASAAATPGPQHVYRREIDLAQRSSLSVLAGLVAAGARVLDLGTGSGSLGRLLRQRGCRVDGVTLSAAEREAAQDGYERLELLDLEQPGWERRFEPGAYDYVICADVLEHLREPERVLQACRGLLRADGWLLASVPNVAYAGMVLELMHGDWKYGPEGLLDRTHLRFYTRRSFERMLAAQGWQVERVEPIDLTWYYTEFWTPFDRLPPAVARYLLAQPDASAYQLVFAARQAGSEAKPHPKQAPVPAADPAVQVAVFASTLEAADAERRPLRIARLGRVGELAQTLSFEIPVQALPAAGLRWHAADRPGYLHLQAITLRDREQRAVWQWQAGQGTDERIRNADRQQIDVGRLDPSGRALVLRLSGDEPCLRLPVDAECASGPGPWRLDIVCGWPFSADYLAVQAALPREPVVEVIVPVYGGLPHLQACLASVLAARCRSPWHLTVIDDASPGADVGRWLREFAALHPEVTVLTNARNLGFTGSVNLGMRLAGRRDVLLLNSDTEVADGWIDRLRRAADGGSRVGTVTPFSNNATICSFPNFCEANALPAGQTTATLDRLFARLHAERTVDVPTAVGFCMYIRRDCLDETGLFDAEAFGAGYGEENDFCLRASARGWRHLHALDVFVRHAGGVSFSDRQRSLQADALAQMQRLHPQYEELVRAYVQRDPARPFREAALQALASAA